MKLNKIFAIALAALTLTACSDDDDNMNTASCTVNMKEQVINASEDMVQDVYYYVPIEVTGNSNGPIRVTVEVSGTGTTPATEGEHYLVTEKTITIPAGQKVGKIEFHPAGDTDINEDRQFLMTIVSAEGATVGQNKTTIINLLDDDHILPEAYAAIEGIYSCNGDGEALNLGIGTYPEGDDNYLKKVIIYGWEGYTWAQVECTFSYDVATGQVRLNIPVGSPVAEDVDFGDIGVCNVYVCGYSADGLSLGGSISVVSNSDLSAFTFQSGIAGGIFNGAASGANFTGYVWFRYLSLNMTKMQ